LEGDIVKNIDVGAYLGLIILLLSALTLILIAEKWLGLDINWNVAGVLSLIWLLMPLVGRSR